MFAPSADINLIHLHAAALRPAQLNLFAHQFANLLEHAPRGFVGHARLALNLFRADPAARRPNQVHGVKPNPQRRARLLKDRPRQRVDVIPTRLASVGRSPFDAVVLLGLLVALVAVGHAAGEALLFNRFQTGIVSREIVVKLIEGVAEFGGGCLASIHGKNGMPYVLLVVKGYLPGGYRYQLVNRYEMMEIPRHLEPSFFDGARRGKPPLYTKSGVSPQTVKPCSSRSASTSCSLPRPRLC